MVSIIANTNKFHIDHLYTVKSSKDCYISLTMQLDTSHLFTRLNGQTVLFVTIHC